MARENSAEPLESELAIQVEYDMDEQGQFTSLDPAFLFTRASDQEWLDAVNAERKKEQLDKVSYGTFEIVMDRLEKEWFDLASHPARSVAEWSLLVYFCRRKIFRNPTWQCHLKILLVQFVTTRRGRIAMPSFFVMDVTWLFIRACPLRLLVTIGM